jgi:hypothetical protein
MIFHSGFGTRKVEDRDVPAGLATKVLAVSRAHTLVPSSLQGRDISNAVTAVIPAFLLPQKSGLRLSGQELSAVSGRHCMYLSDYHFICKTRPTILETLFDYFLFDQRLEVSLLALNQIPQGVAKVTEN